MIGRTIDQLAVGDAAELTREVTQGDILSFVGSVGDRNPVHSDPAFAASTPFHEPIAPGIWTAGLISAVIGTELPGPGSIYVTQELRFLLPVKAGDSITTRVEVVEILPERNRVRLRTTCRNQRGKEVLAGEAWVLPTKVPISYPTPIEGQPSQEPSPA
jgi:acyl dehydratase